jgi:hypothetical protein
MLSRFALRVLACSTCAFALRAAQAAEVIYAFDEASATLVTLDPSTGATDVVGALPVGAGGIADFASANGRLYALVSEFPTQSRILEIDPATAAVLSDAVITVDGIIAQFAVEAIATDAAGTIVVSLWRTDGVSTFNSNNLGTLGLDGAVTNIVSYGPTADFDGLATDPAGGLVGLNREPNSPGEFIQLLNVSYPRGTSSVIVTMPISDEINLVDDVVVFGGQILSADRLTNRVNRHNRRTGVIETVVSYPETASIYAALAVVEVAEPCVGDIDGDGNVGPVDVSILLGAWGTSGAADLDASGDVGSPDLAIVLGAWGACP